LQISCTAFILGQTILENINLFKKLRNEPLWNIEQHTFSHIPLRTVKPKYELNKSVKGESLEIIERDIARANKLFEDILRIHCKGLCAPKGYFNGLNDRSDILKILASNGIQFVRSYGRNIQDWQPVPFEIQPFWYEEEGFPDILEIPGQGWQDTIWRRTYGWTNKKGFLDFLKDSVDYVLQNRLVWSCYFHDWSCIQKDSDLSIMRAFFEYALKRGAIFMSHLDYYELMKKKKNGNSIR
jgi:peptidoglycan/xylan/chitin deacetylase (PgdA/CDA1 family)